MIARIWFGYVLKEKAENFYNYMVKTGVDDIKKSEGNQGVLILQSNNNILAKFTFISLWDTEESMIKFFKSDSDEAKLYPKDKDYLLTSGEKVKFANAYFFSNETVSTAKNKKYGSIELNNDS